MTPYELYLALTAPADGSPLWGSEWISDFERVMSLRTELPEENQDEDVPHYSLVSGKLVHSDASRPMRRVSRAQIDYDANDASLIKCSKQVMVKEDGTVSLRGVRSLAAEKLLERSWRGLDPPNEGDGGSEVEIGRDGVARRYLSDNNVS